MATKYHDYYQTLGVARDASADDVQRAYRKLARQYHPDVNKSPEAEAKFKEINEANEVLSDPDKRKRYDALGANWKAGQDFRPPPGSAWEGFGRDGRGGFRVEYGGMGGGEGGDFSDFFEALFGRARSGGHAGGSPFGGMGGFDVDDLGGGGRSRANRHRSASRPRAGQSHEAEITVTLEDVYHGAARQITLQSSDESGARTSRTYDVRIPPGITDGSVIRLSGQGGAGAAGGPAGDLLLRVRIAPDTNFRIEDGGHDLTTTLAIEPWQAALGAKVTVRTFDGEIVLTIPPGSQSGQRLRIRGKGLPTRTGARGDLFAELRITVPKELSPAQRAAYESLRDAS